MIFLGALAGAMLIFPGVAAEAAGQALSLWARAVVPSLGPFMACMLMLSGRMGGGMLPRVLMGWLCGSPGGARLMCEMRLGKPSALRCAALAGTMSPMFFISTVSGWLGNARDGRIILVCHLLGAALLGWLIPGKRQQVKIPPRPNPFFAVLADCAQALLTIALCMMLGSVAAKMAGCALSFLPPFFSVVLQCGLEVTGGVQALIGEQPPLMMPLICAACSFGGLSILLQNGVYWQKAGLRLGELFLLRLGHALISFILCFVAEKIL